MQLLEQTNSFIKDIIAELDDQTITKERWFELHAKCLAAKHLGSKLARYSRDKAIGHWGMDFVADSEVQIEFDLGVKFEDEKPSLNAHDKSVGIVTIEATHSSFLLWERKIADALPTWEPDSLRRVLELLEPMEMKAKEVREILKGHEC